MRVLYGKISDEVFFGHLDLLSKVAEVNTVYKLVKVITCEIIDPASRNSVCGFFMGRSQKNLYSGQLDLLSKLLRSTQCISL